MEDFIYDWNRKTGFDRRRKVELYDDTFRDGLQATYVRYPLLESKIKLLSVMEKLEIECANIGYPIAGEEQKKDVIALAKHVQKNQFKIHLGCGARVLIGDVEEIVDVSQRTGVPIEAGLFVGSSRIRHLVERWDLKEMGQKIKESIFFAVKNGLSVMFVTEDTTRADPKTIRYLYRTAVESGATRICVCDTVGHALPWSTYQLIKFVREKIIKENKQVKIDWHGHNDRGLAVANSLAAVKAGVNRVQATALGVGERAGNACMIQLIVNLQTEGLVNKNLKYLKKYTAEAAKALGVKIPPNYPLVGRDVFKTATGVHAAAIKKAEKTGDGHLAGIVYSAIDPTVLGKKPEILVGPMSGKANVEWVLESLNLPKKSRLIRAVLKVAKYERKILTRAEVIKISQEST